MGAQACRSRQCTIAEDVVPVLFLNHPRTRVRVDFIFYFLSFMFFRYSELNVVFSLLLDLSKAAWAPQIWLMEPGGCCCVASGLLVHLLARGPELAP